MADRLQQLETFVRVVDRGSFSSAARELGTTQPSVSRVVAALEARLGVDLLLRNTRKLTLTEAGKRLLDRARTIVADALEAEDAARSETTLQGMLRVATTTAFGTRELVPLLPEFLAANPGLRLDLVMSDRIEDLIADRIDVAFRIGKLADSGFAARRLASVPRYAVAAPAYVAKRGRPKVPEDLVKHDCVCGPGARPHDGWVFRRANGTTVTVPVTGLVEAGTGPALVACASEGLGITIVALFMARAEFEAGTLVRVLPEFGLDPLELHAVFPSRRRPSTKGRALATHVAARLPVALSERMAKTRTRSA